MNLHVCNTSSSEANVHHCTTLVQHCLTSLFTINKKRWSDRSPQSSRGRELHSKRHQYSQRTLEVADSVSTSSTNSSKHIAEDPQPTSLPLPSAKPSVNPTAVISIGTIGYKIMLRANLFTVNISDDLGYIHHYDGQIIPKAPRKINVAVIDKMVNDNPAIFGRQKVVYDGQKNLYVHKPLNGISAQNEVYMLIYLVLKERKWSVFFHLNLLQSNCKLEHS